MKTNILLINKALSSRTISQGFIAAVCLAFDPENRKKHSSILLC